MALRALSRRAAFLHALTAQPAPWQAAVAAQVPAWRGFRSTGMAAGKKKKKNARGAPGHSQQYALRLRLAELVKQGKERREPKEEEEDADGKPYVIGPNAIAYITATRNNTFVLFSDADGRVLCKHSAGSVGYKGAKRSTGIAAQTTAERTAARAKELGVERIWVKLRGFGQGRNTGLRALTNSGLEVMAIYEDTPVPHGGDRPKRRRRI